MTDKQTIKHRIEALRSKQKRVGPFRAAGIQLSINNFKKILAAMEPSK